MSINNTRNPLGWVEIVATLALVTTITIATNGIAHHVEPALRDTTAGMTRTQQENLEKFASASLFGQFRSSMADFLWLKVDKYLHNGVDLRATTDQERQAPVDKVQSAAGQDGYRAHNGGETTVVPSQSRDWRGRLGDLERSVMPYKDMANHKHADPKEALPLFRLMVWSNPHFIPGYVNGASLLAGEKRVDEALAFLENGEQQNPQSIEIQTALGETLMFRRHDWAKSLPYLQRAMMLGAARDAQTLNEDEREAWQGAFRWMVLNRRDAGDPAAARRVAQEGLRLFPDDVVCHRYLSGQIVTPSSVK